MRGHPGLGWRGSCLLLAGGLAGCATGPEPLPVAIDESSGEQVEVVLTASTTQPPRRPVASWSKLGRASAVEPQPAAATAATADVLAAAHQLEQADRLIEAQRAYLDVLQRYPQHVECMHRLAVVCTRMSEFDAARAYFDRALLIQPGNVSMLTDAGNSRYLAGEYRQAERLLRRALELSPKDVNATNNLAVVIGVSGRFDDALALFWQVNPPATAWTNLAYIYQVRDEPDLALTCYQNAHAVDETVLVPEELLAQMEPDEPLASDADLPPLPTAAPARLTKRAAPRASRSLSKPVLSSPIALEERASDPNPRPSLPAVAPATVAAKSVTTVEAERPTATPVVVTSARSTWSAVPLTETKERFAQPLEVAALRRSPRSEPAWQPSPQPEAEDPFDRLDPPATPVEERVSVENTPVLVAAAVQFEPRPITPAENEETALFAAPVQLAPIVIEDAPPFAEYVLQVAGAGSSFDEEDPFATDAEDDPIEAAFISGERAKLTDRATRAGLKGFCLVTLSEERRLVDALGEFAVEYRAQNYEFSSSDASRRFKADPEFYAPAAGGLDVISVRDGSGVVPGSLDHACWYRDRLYMFASQRHKNEFRTGPRKFLPAQ